MKTLSQLIDAEVASAAANLQGSPQNIGLGVHCRVESLLKERPLAASLIAFPGEQPISMMEFSRITVDIRNEEEIRALIREAIGDQAKRYLGSLAES